MKPDTIKKIKEGLYEYTFGDLTFRVVQILDGDKGSGVFGKWYFVNANPADNEEDEGGTDHYKSKKAAVMALCEYRRSGCKMCKYWKVNGFATERKDGERFADHKRRSFAEKDVKDGT